MVHGVQAFTQGMRRAFQAHQHQLAGQAQLFLRGGVQLLREIGQPRDLVRALRQRQDAFYGRVRLVSGAGSTLKLSSVTTDRVPQEPASSLLRSYPVTFLITLPPDL